jgi:putative RNA 2'-phosphotransferase
MNESRATRVSKFLALVLRHRPEAAGVTLDPEGWVSIDALVAGCVEHGHPLTRAELLEVVRLSDKQRFAVRDGLIRANQGHSVAVDLALAPRRPPDVLFHGTVQRFLPPIRRDGLLRGKRTHVHLSPDVETARRVGQRRGEAIVLEVDAAAMADAGLAFYRSENGVWLTDFVAPRYLKFPG